MQATHDNITIWSLVSDASLLVQAVMLILLLASIASWYLIVLRGTQLRRTEAHLRDFERRLRSNGNLARLVRTSAAVPPGHDAMQHIFDAGYHAFEHLRAEPDIAPAAVLDGVERSLQIAIGEQAEQLERGLPFLATVGSVSPYIGLFGTVWGIMNAFIGLSQVQQATLGAVAPGIAEALVATAIGLFAAIPAVIAYNRLAARGQTLLARYQRFADELQALMHRSLHTSRPLAAA